VAHLLPPWPAQIPTNPLSGFRGPTPTDGTSSSTPLRFDEPAPVEGAQAPACTQCGTSIRTSYYELGGHVFCPACKGRFETELSRGSGAGRFARAAAFGLGAAAVGAGIYYAILALTGYEVGLVAILVGWLVGQAVHRGAGRSRRMGLPVTRGRAHLLRHCEHLHPDDREGDQ
jgi:hypothetical protein